MKLIDVVLIIGIVFLAFAVSSFLGGFLVPVVGIVGTVIALRLIIGLLQEWL